MRHVETKIPLLIVQVEPPQKGDGGDYFYRTHAPGIAMAHEEGIYVVNLTNVHRKKLEIMNLADVLILKNISDPDLLPLTRNRKSESRLNVYEIADDLNALQPWNPVYIFSKNKENMASVYHLASCCDALQVTVPELKRLYGHLNDNCEVFPNQILHVPPKRPVRGDDKIIIGWGGSHGHLEDVAEIAEALINWVITQPDVCLHLMCSEPIWKLFDRMPENKKRRTLPGSIDNYYGFLTEIDIGIAPLKDTAFNRSRSDIKFMEYAVSGVVPVMAKQEPYFYSVEDGKTGFLFENSVELIHILNQLVKNRFLLRNISRAARQYVLKERLQSQHARDRVDFYKALIRRLQGSNEQIGLGCERFGEWARLEGAVKEGRHLKLLPTHFENLLHDGLVAMQMDGDKKLARAFFERASALEPGNYLPFLFGASVSPDPIESLRNALGRKPDSVKAWILLGQEYAKKGEIREALKSFDSGALIYPGYEVPYLRAANLLKVIGQQAQSDMLFQKAKSLEVYDSSVSQSADRYL